MEYLILIYNDERNYGSASEAQLKEMYQQYGAYTQELVKAGIMKGGNELKPVATATTVRMRGGKVLTTDGPFAETKEQLGGYYLIDVPNLDEAVKGREVPGRQDRLDRGTADQSALSTESSDRARPHRRRAGAS